MNHFNFKINDFKRMKREIKNIFKSFELLKEEYELHYGSLTLAINDYKENEISNYLKSLPIDALQKYRVGVPIARLKAAGIDTVYMAKIMGHSLTNIYGIGTYSASQTIGIIKSLEEKYSPKIIIKMDKHHRTPFTDLIARRLVICNYIVKTLKVWKVFYAENLETINSLIYTIRTKTSFLSRLFSSKQYEEIVNRSFNELKSIFENKIKPLSKYLDDYKVLKTYGFDLTWDILTEEFDNCVNLFPKWTIVDTSCFQ